MQEMNNILKQSIIRDMSEGVMSIDFDGVIRIVNPAACEILQKSYQGLIDHSFAHSFFEYEENDAFNQTVLDAIYDSGSTHKNIVSYFDGKDEKKLHITTSFLKNEGEKLGIIIVLNDISELLDLRNTVKAMDEIKRLNSALSLRNQLLSETFGRYLSDEIVKSLLDTPDGLMLGGKKQNITILFCDIRGFTAISESMATGDLLSMLNHYFSVMTDSISEYQGTIIEFLGDSIFAIFGAPLRFYDHGEKAVACAVKMQNDMAIVNGYNHQHGFPKLEMGIALHSGDVIVGNIGSLKRTKYGAVGKHVNLCARIESYTLGGQILISEDTEQRIKVPLITCNEQIIYPKGAEEALHIFQVEGIGEPYSLILQCYVKPTIPLDCPEPISVAFVENKQCIPTFMECFFTEVSQDAGRIVGMGKVQQYANLKISSKYGTAYGKVVEGDKNYILVRFTSKDKQLEQWLLEQEKGCIHYTR